MNSKLRILFIEDSENDALLLLRELQKGGYDVQWERVQTAADVQAALARQPWDLIICDYSIPPMNAPQALEILQKSGLDLPFIIVSGTIGEEAAVSALKAGAHDFLIKGNLARLLPAIERELKDAKNRQEHKQAEEKIRRQLNYLTALQDIDRTIASAFDMRLSLDALISRAVSLLKVDAASVLLTNSSTNNFEFAAADGFRTTAVKTASIKLEKSYAGRAAMKQRIVKIPNLQDQPDDLFLPGFLEGEDFVSYYGAPLIVKGKVIGVMEVFQRSLIKHDQEWLDFLNALAGQAAIAISNAQLFDSLQRSNNELIHAYDATIEGWSRAMDLRDKETEGHTLRVTEMSLRLANLMHISDVEQVQVRRGALLHDIGKLGVPDAILFKPGKLTDEEWEIMRRHPIYAYEMLSSVEYLKPALDIPYAHHEKWDGTGYPRGLKGELIPFSARIFAVVDVWDALTSDRPYRPAWSEEKTLEYIREQSGKHFDPQAVEIFLREIRTDN